MLKQYYTCQSDYVVAIDDGRILMKMVELDSKKKQRMVYVRLTEVYRSLNQIEWSIARRSSSMRTDIMAGRQWPSSPRLTTTLLEPAFVVALYLRFLYVPGQVSPSFRQLTFGRASYSYRHPDKPLGHHGQPNSCRCHGQVGASLVSSRA